MAGAVIKAELRNRVLDLFYPPRCGGCDRRGTWFCRECRLSIKPASGESHSIMDVRAVVSAGAFDGPLREAIHNLKYENDRPLARPLAELVYVALQGSARWPRMVDRQPAIVPVPLHIDRQRARGFNQAHLLALELSRYTGWAVDTSLSRRRNTRSQVGLSAAARGENVYDAFSWTGEQPPSGVLLLDDVLTTGSTLKECAGAVRAAGGQEIYVATVARARGI